LCTQPKRQDEVPRIGIRIQNKNTQDTVLHANQIADRQLDKIDKGYQTTEAP